ncbi:MAG: phage Gp37/Gp68 family protein [Nitrososphaerota archaeon]|jgi:protein gp37|nr:phage Gp37/Gp68 family protein [Nitrososphaerota archaeon]MDG6927200.1 phage Gp37/Gp68 family protein [Nitrososphaerota archaeon]MDG6930812.1 phage Gp37/Gp68 family protein [Nitrososphaerota archaeon]MDG6932256.1 phage Gp37/Gp68 family protein [Nitrososphaerota archaeon]MDG6936339.1 phage Gp37/Gp68 family protein [Nitrososphaerota archaeon]
MNKTGISWTDITWNPVTGCSKVSPGCQNCYAETWSRRFGRSFDVQIHPERLGQVSKLPAGAKVFVNSMSDLFHEYVSFEFVKETMGLIASRPDVTFQVLTKRAERMVAYETWIGEPFPQNLWLGVSVELPLYLKRIDSLVSTSARTKFVSFEPLLGELGDLNLTGINLVIIGGESGPRHRPMRLEWARSIVRQAKEQGVAVWMKQLGGARPGGDLNDFPKDLRIREFPMVVQE